MDILKNSELSISRSESDSSIASNNLFGVPVNLQASEKKNDQVDYSSLDLSDLELESQLNSVLKQASYISCLNLCNNQIRTLPTNLIDFKNLSTLDLSKNNLKVLNPIITSLSSLTVLFLSNNILDENSFPKDFGSVFANKLKVLSLSGNNLRTIPEQILQLSNLRSLYLGANKIEKLTPEISRISALQFLYLGGNELTDIPDEVGELSKLEALSLCENKLTRLPISIAQLNNLRSLALHKNQLTTLPIGILQLNNLMELSLRNNPLVVHFIRDLVYNPPTLLEISARCIKINKIAYDCLPRSLIHYLGTARNCVNPKCKGVYFDSHAEHIKFVDFCGAFRVPLMQYLCSASCSSTKPAHDGEDSGDVSESKLKKVLLG